jgi:hypothetical protein
MSKDFNHFNPIEDYLHLVTLGRIERGDRQVGFCILGTDNQKPDLSKLVIKFGIKCQGIHPLQRSDEQYVAINQALEAGFKELDDCTVTFRWSSFCDDDNTLTNQGFNPAVNSAVSKEIFYFEQAQKAKIQELIKKNIARL